MATEKRMIAEALKKYHDSKFTPGVYEHSIFGKAAMLLESDAVEVPCKRGNTVFGIKVYNHGRLIVKQGVVSQMFFGEDMRLCICVKGVCRGEWGVNVFASREEAEAAIGERRTDNA